MHSFLIFLQPLASNWRLTHDLSASRLRKLIGQVMQMLLTLRKIFILKVSHLKDTVRHKKQKIKDLTFSTGTLNSPIG